MKKETLSYKRVQELINNWAELDKLRNDEVIKAFQIRNNIEMAFKAEKDARQKVEKERSNLSEEIAKNIDEKTPDYSNAKIEQFPDGSVSFIGLPNNIKTKLKELNNQLTNFGEKTHSVEFDPLTKEDLQKHDLLTGKIIRLFPELLDLSEKKDDNNKNKKETKS